MTKEELRRRVDAIKWFHVMDLGHGIVTPGWEKHTAAKLGTIGLPDSLAGRTVLDIGAWDGFFSFEAERRGAKRVLATDHHCWGGMGWGSKDGFLLAREALGSHVEDMEIDVLDLSPMNVGTFDLVLFLGVLYHMRHPLLALERVADVTKDMLILETHIGDHTDRPLMVFYPGAELADDVSNWWGPNEACVKAMLFDVGFKVVAVYHRAGDRATFHACK